MARTYLISRDTKPIWSKDTTSTGSGGILIVRSEREDSMRTADDEFAHFTQDVTPGLRRLAIALCADPHRAEDLLQSTLEKMYPGWGRGRIENPAAYARRVLVRTLAAEQRRGWWKRERPTDELPWVVADDAHRKTDLRIVLYQALRALPPRQRQAVVLRFLEDL